MIDWGWFYFITKPMFWLIDSIYRYVGNFGIAILIVTVLVKLAFFPLANRCYRSMAKMKEIQPQIAALKERYPDDKVKQQQEQMELFKREKRQPGRRLPADGDPDSGVLRALQGASSSPSRCAMRRSSAGSRICRAPDPTNIFTLFGLIPWDPTALPVFGHFLHSASGRSSWASRCSSR